MRDTKLSRDIIDDVTQNPGSFTDDIAARIGKTIPNVGCAAKRLCERGVLSRAKVPGTHGHYAYFVPEYTLEPEIDDAAVGVITELQMRVEALEQWKADAIKRHPDLAVDPLLLKAREIVAAMFEVDGVRHAILDGEHDDRAPVQAALAALRSTQN